MLRLAHRRVSGGRQRRAARRAYSSLIDLLQAAVGEVAKATAQAAESASQAADLHDATEAQISASLSADNAQIS